MLILITLILGDIQKTQTATFQFIFPEKSVDTVRARKIKKIPPSISLKTVSKKGHDLVVKLSSRESTQFRLKALYGDSIIVRSKLKNIDGKKTLKIPAYFNSEDNKLKWINVVWEGDELLLYSGALIGGKSKKVDLAYKKNPLHPSK